MYNAQKSAIELLTGPAPSLIYRSRLIILPVVHETACLTIVMDYCVIHSTPLFLREGQHLLQNLGLAPKRFGISSTQL